MITWSTAEGIFFSTMRTKPRYTFSVIFSRNLCKRAEKLALTLSSDWLAILVTRIGNNADLTLGFCDLILLKTKVEDQN